MLQKLILLIITAIFLSGCGAAAPEETVAAAVPGSVEFHRADKYGQKPETIASEAESMTLNGGEEPAETAGEAEYFLFSEYTNTVTDEEGMALLYENQSVVTFTSSDEERSAWVGGVLEDIDRNYRADSSNLYDYAADYIELNGTEGFYSHSNYQQLGIARHDETVVSLICLSSLYSGGSHPISVQVAYNMDIENQRLLRLEDVIAEGTAGELAVLVREAVDEKFATLDGGNGLFEDYGDVISTSMTYGNMTPYWYLNDTGLVIFYNQYELGPYAAGIIKVVLPYERLEGILLEEYFPAEADGIDSDLVLRGGLAGRRSIPITIEPAGETLLVGVEGQVHQVQLSEVLWLQDTPIAQDLLFSAMTLGQNDVLEITGGYTDDSRSFAIEFTNGDGERRIYYIRDGGLWEEP